MADPWGLHFMSGSQYGLLDNVPNDNYFWDAGDGTKGRDRYFDHQYEREGTYLVRLTTIDTGGTRNSTVKVLTVRNDGAFPQMGLHIEGGDIQQVNTSIAFDHNQHSQFSNGSAHYFFLRFQ